MVEARPTSAMGSPAGHLGPFEVKGTLTAEQRQEIKEATGCSAAIRERGQWAARMLTVTGPCDKLEAAHKMALEKVALNGEDGGRAPPAEPQPAKASWNKRGWDDWKRQDWPTREEVQDLKKKLAEAEQRIANNSYRVQVLEGWYWYCNQYEGGYPNAAQSWYPNPANGYNPATGYGSSADKYEKEKKKKKPRSPSQSSATKSARGRSEASSAPTLLVPQDGHMESVPEEATKVRKKRVKKRDPPPPEDDERTQWRPKHPHKKEK